MRKLMLIALFVSMAGAYAWAGDSVVTEVNTSFDMDEVTIRAGDAVTFSNKDDVTHNIQVADGNGKIEDLGIQKPGQDTKETFAKQGEYKIHCAIYPKMKMTVVVR